MDEKRIKEMYNLEVVLAWSVEIEIRRVLEGKFGSWDGTLGIMIAIFP